MCAILHSAVRSGGFMPIPKLMNARTGWTSVFERLHVTLTAHGGRLLCGTRTDPWRQFGARLRRHWKPAVRGAARRLHARASARRATLGHGGAFSRARGLDGPRHRPVSTTDRGRGPTDPLRRNPRPLPAHHRGEALRRIARALRQRGTGDSACFVVAKAV